MDLQIDITIPTNASSGLDENVLNFRLQSPFLH